jgi:hypothetical protein
MRTRRSIRFSSPFDEPIGSWHGDQVRLDAVSPCGHGKPCHPAG